MAYFYRVLMGALLFFVLPVISLAADRSFIVLHTNDWQSRLLGFGPNTNYSPQTVNDDDTQGGVARLATLIEQRREAAGDIPVLLLDAGDFSMGTLFHTISREQAPELRLMHALGYDAVTLGNHEFDFRPSGLAQMLSAAEQGGALVPIVASNIRFDADNPDDDALEAHQQAGTIQPYLVIERGSIRLGLFGLLGKNAIEVSPMAAPVTFADPIESAREMVQILREQERVDLVILLGHIGTRWQAGNFYGETLELISQVPGIDLVVDGHSHSVLTQPLRSNKTIVVQAGSEIQYLGELHMRLPDKGSPSVQSYQLHKIDDRILGDSAISQQVEEFKQQVNEQVLEPLGYQFDQPLATVERRLTREQSDPILGHLLTDALRKAGESDIAISGNGVLRDDLYPGVQAVSDLFRVSSLGIGVHDHDPGYPLVKLYFNAAEIKSIFEVLLLAWKWREADSYFPYFSGARLTWNPFRVPFDRISRLELGDESKGFAPLDLSSRNTRLYSITASSYVASFLWLVPNLSKGLLQVTPKDAQGRPFAHLADAVIDRDLNQPCVQEYKEWQALLDYVQSLPDLNGDGLADIPVSGAIAQTRMQKVASLSPIELYRNSGQPQWIASTIGGLILLLVLGMWISRLHHRKLGSG